MGELLSFQPLHLKVFESDEDGDVKVLEYELVRQEQTNWCWAAVSLAVARFFRDDVDATQGAIVDAQLGRDDCCGDGAQGPCNVPHVIYGALEQLGHYAGKKAQGKPEFDLARAEVAAGRPLAVLLKWFGGGGHFVAVVGFSDEGGLLHVADPWYGDALVAHQAFPNVYQHGADWGWTYWTKE
ncbi:MAG: C39 family peptidase [Planctomycetota bacterium]|nr:C39 family peptidase [Planctomycetota bacterium]